MSKTTLADRLRARIRVSDAGCWEWQGPLSSGGYGRISVNGHQKAVHRVAYELLVGPVPTELHLVAKVEK